MTSIKKFLFALIGALALFFTACDNDYRSGYIWISSEYENEASEEYSSSSDLFPYYVFSSSSYMSTMPSVSTKALIPVSSSSSKSYEFVKIGSQEWMTENLSDPVDGAVWCYINSIANCEEYGSLYTWSQAMGVDSKYDSEQLGEIALPHQGICPEGSHLPSNAEWQELYQHISAYPEDKKYFTNQIAGVYDWQNYYRSIGEETVFWTSTEYDVTGTYYGFEFAWIWAYREDGSVDRSNPHKYMGASIRCVK